MAYTPTRKRQNAVRAAVFTPLTFHDWCVAVIVFGVAIFLFIM